MTAKSKTKKPASRTRTAAKAPKPAKPKAAKPTKASKPAQSSKSARSVRSAKVVKSAKSTKAAKPAPSVKAAKSAKAKPGSKSAAKPKTVAKAKTLGVARPRAVERAPHSKAAPTVRSAGVVQAANPPRKFPVEAARALWFARQGIGAAADVPLQKMVARTGWLRTLGGADVYIAVRARRAGARRHDLDEAVASHGLRVIPAVRSCIYLVPEEHADVALKFADEIWRKRTDTELSRAGTSWKEVAAVGQAVVSVLENGPLSTDAIRKAVPAGTLRSLGEAGKKVGLSSPLPVALRDLEFSGKIERTLDGGRLDTERYVWRAAEPAPSSANPMTQADRLDAIARIFFSQMGPATVAHFAEWAGVSQREAAASIAREGFVQVEIEGYSKVAYVDEVGIPGLDQPTSYLGGHVAFLSFEDNFLVPHGGPALLCDPAHHGRPVHSWGLSRPTTLGEAKHLASRTIIIGDKIAGFWEYDPDAQEVVTLLFDHHPRDMADHVEAEATAFARFLFEDIGHGRSFSLDTDDAVRERAKALRQMR